MRKRQNLTWTILCSCLSIWAASRSWGFEDGANPVGLNGLIPSYAPEGLTDEDFKNLQESIDASWKPWVEETGKFVKEFYEGNAQTVAEQRVALQRLQVKLGTLEKALADPRYRSIHRQLQSLYGKLGPEASLAQAFLDTLTLEPAAARAERLEPAFNQLHQAVDALQADLKTYRNGNDWVTWIRLDQLKNLKADDPAAPAIVDQLLTKLGNRETYTPEIRDFVSREPFLAVEDALQAIHNAATQEVVSEPAELRSLYTQLIEALNAYHTEPSTPNETKIRQILEEVRAKSPDGGVAVAGALGRNYLNYNLRLAVSEGFVNRFFSETRREQSQIRDRVMQASVYGYQCSDVTTRLDLVPSEVNAKFNLQLTGTIFANTNGVTSQATIHTIGRHSFNGSKLVAFDGQNFYLEPGHVSARANNQTVGATTKFSRVPLFGRVANNIAVRKANELRPQTNALAVRKITDQVSEELEREAAEQFANASKQLQTKTYGPLRKYNLYPDVMALSTTDSELRLWTRLMDSDEIAGSQAVPIASIPSDGMVAQIHESLLSHAFDRLGLNGKTMTEDEVRQLLESRLSEILDRKVEIPKPAGQADASEQAANTLVFAEEDPVRFTIRDGVVTVFIQAGLKRDNGDDIPTQIISVPFQPTLQGDKIILTRGNVGVKPVVRPPSVAAQVARAQVMRQKIQSALPEQSVNRTMEVKTQNDKVVKLTVADIVAEGGWLVLTIK
ncbi:hypothetical protein SH661x_004548 [Planctomicrobium sp. SH661]|uniref:hypothetical protein n=1 Tax=Planctomicrobium sp. SH661 TaxID=3448124 RepID=UPI003F5C2D43